MVRPTVISTFAGCGGSSLGYELAGFKELLAIDFDKNSRDTFILNFPDTTYWLKDIKQITSQEILDFCEIKKGELDVLDGSPPCQGFSTAGKRKVNDSRNDLFVDFVRLIRELQPKVFVMENVSGQVKGIMKGRFKEIILTLKSLNYKVRCKLLNAANYDVPQKRQRLFYIGVRKDLNVEPAFPTPNSTTISYGSILEKNTKFTFLTKKEVDKVIKHAKQQKLKGNSFGFHYNSPLKPFRTITKTKSSNALIKVNDLYRYPTVTELKRICSFPDDFKLIGTFEQQWARLGNAVMPNQMKAIANTIRQEILK